MKIEKFYNKKERAWQYRARFQLNNKNFAPKADTRKRLLELVDEIRLQEHRDKFNLETPKHSPYLKELFDKHAPRIAKPKHRGFFARVAKKFLSISPTGIKVAELKKAHFQHYIDVRLNDFGIQTKKPIQRETAYKELWALRAALSQAELYYSELENWKPPHLPKNPETKSRFENRRQALESPEITLKRLLGFLREPRKNQTAAAHYHRVRLADNLEFRYQTGLRRKEVATLTRSNYFPKEQALRNVKRWKTDTVTKFFPLSVRAVEIIEERLKLQSDSKFIFTPDGEPIETDYRTLKEVCAELEIPYGKFTEGGFVPHDLRHNFASELIQHTDIETARELLGHSNAAQTLHYTHTNESRMREAMNNRHGNNRRDLISFYKDVRRGKIKAKTFLQKLENLAIL